MTHMVLIVYIETLSIWKGNVLILLLKTATSRHRQQKQQQQRKLQTQNMPNKCTDESIAQQMK